MAKSGLMGKRIPTLLGLFILIGGLVAGIALVNTRQGIESKAGPTESPKNIKISNKGSSTFSISWTTDIPLTGFVKYSDNPAKINLPAGDVRDQISGSSQSYTNHLANITGLKPNTTYYFLIGSGSQTYDDGGKAFQIRTSAQVIAPPEDVIFGKVVGGSGNPTNGAIVHVEAEGGESQSIITKADGTWRLNLANSRKADGSVLTYDSAKTLLSIFVQAGSAGTATAITDVGHAKPVPDIVLGKNQSFIENGSAALVSTLAGSDTGAGATTVATGSAERSVGGFQAELAETSMLSNLQVATSEAKILNPAIDGEIIATTSPQLKGSGQANTTVKVSIKANDEQTAVVSINTSGIWLWTPPRPLAVGNNTVTVDYTDEKNVSQKLSRPFTVLSAAGSVGIPAFTATPSATPSITPTITISLTPIPTPTEIFIMPATDSGELDDAGTLSTTIALILVGIGMVLFGKLSKRWVD